MVLEVIIHQPPLHWLLLPKEIQIYTCLGNWILALTVFLE